MEKNKENNFSLFSKINFLIYKMTIVDERNFNYSEIYRVSQYTWDPCDC